MRNIEKIDRIKHLISMFFLFIALLFMISALFIYLFGSLKEPGYFFVNLMGYLMGLIILLVIFAISIISVVKDIKYFLELKKNKESSMIEPCVIYAKYKDFDFYYSSYGSKSDGSASGMAIICSWLNPEDKKLYFFKSCYFGFDYDFNHDFDDGSNFNKYLKEHNITEFKVTYDKTNIKNYKIDIGILLEGNKYYEK